MLVLFLSPPALLQQLSYRHLQLTLYLYARSLWKVANVNLEMSDEETEEEYESRKKAEWCCGA